MDQDRFWLTDAQFSKTEPLLPTDTRGKARVDDRRVMSGIVQVLKSGGRWIDAPSEYGPKKTLYNRYVRWAEKGVWIDLFHALARAGGGRHKLRLVVEIDMGGAFDPEQLLGLVRGQRAKFLCCF
jgi:transposase